VILPDETSRTHDHLTFKNPRCANHMKASAPSAPLYARCWGDPVIMENGEVSFIHWLQSWVLRAFHLRSNNLPAVLQTKAITSRNYQVARHLSLSKPGHEGRQPQNPADLTCKFPSPATHLNREKRAFTTEIKLGGLRNAHGRLENGKQALQV